MRSYRVSYLIIAHKLPTQVRRLVERLSTPESTFWIHVDRKADQSAFEKELAQFPNLHFVSQRVHPRWGHYDFVRSFLLSLEEIQKSGKPYDHLVFLSGQDYPLVSTRQLMEFMARHQQQSFIHHVPLRVDETPHLWERLQKYHVHIPGNKAIIYPYENAQFTKRIINTLFRFSGQFPLPRVLPGQMKPFFGSNWIRITPQAVAYVLNFIRQNPAIDTYFKYTHLPDEHFFQTIFMNASDQERGKVINSNFTFSHWKRPAELYTTPLNRSDLDSLISSGDLFARKFDQTYDVTILDWLDKHHS